MSLIDGTTSRPGCVIKSEQQSFQHGMKGENNNVISRNTKRALHSLLWAMHFVGDTITFVDNTVTALHNTLSARSNTLITVAEKVV